MTLAQDPDLADHDLLESPELEAIRERLHRDFSDLPVNVVDRCLESEATRFDGARISSFVPILVDKNTRAWLRDLRAAG